MNYKEKQKEIVAIQVNKTTIQTSDGKLYITNTAEATESEVKQVENFLKSVQQEIPCKISYHYTTSKTLKKTVSSLTVVVSEKYSNLADIVGLATITIALHQELINLGARKVIFKNILADMKPYA